MRLYRFRHTMMFAVLVLAAAAVSAHASQKISFEVRVHPSLQRHWPPNGRLFVILGRDPQREPRRLVGWAGPRAIPFFGVDVKNWRPRDVKVVGENSTGFPIESIHELTPGTYYAQALYDVDTTFSTINAPGNVYSPVQKIEILGDALQEFQLVLKHRIPDEAVPEDSRFVKFVRIRSRLLSDFWGKPMYLRAGIILPGDYYKHPERRFPVRYHIGGYHARYTRVQRLMQPGSAFRKMWFSEDCPQMIYVHLDGEAPFGDSYQINSANNGPYGDATVKELIPYIENTFRAIGRPEARFLDGGSTGGWVSLALQIFYPDSFNGAWSYCADPVDFRYFQLVNVYEDTNAFVNEYGYERPSMRDTDGEPRFSIRREIMMERALGRGNTFVTSGGQWGAWNAVFSPRGANGWPMAIWDSYTGRIDPRVARHWEKYDLRLVLQRNWATLGPKLRGKLHIWMGDMDNFYLDNAMRLLEAFLKQAENPPSDAQIVFAPDEGHCWLGISEKEMMRRMVQRVPGSLR